MWDEPEQNYNLSSDYGNSSYNGSDLTEENDLNLCSLYWNEGMYDNHQGQFSVTYSIIYPCLSSNGSGIRTFRRRRDVFQLRYILCANQRTSCFVPKNAFSIIRFEFVSSGYISIVLPTIQNGR